MGSGSFRKEFAVGVAGRGEKRREALGASFNEVSFVDLVHTRARLALDLISTLAGIFERAEDIKPD